VGPVLLAVMLASAATAWGRDANYVPATQVSLETILAPPPVIGSASEQKDLQAVLDVQKRRSAAESKEAEGDAELSVFRFADVLGERFNADNAAFTAQFLRRTLSDAGESISSAKAHFKRDRPFLRSAEVQPIIRKPGGGSYPSGHATFAFLNGILLAAMVPEKAAQIHERAERYAYNRVTAGVHFPTDIEAGRISAAVIANGLLHEPKFLADLEAAKAEVRKALEL
jgi:acid phosphatase (class A)